MPYNINPFTGKFDEVSDLSDYAKLDGTNQPFTGDVVTSTGFYIGDETTDGSWRFVPSGTSLKIERRESGSWIEKGEFTA